MTTRIGINGFGRIGRSVLRAALENEADVEVVAVNDVANITTLATLLEWDSINGHLPEVSVEGDRIHIGDLSISMTSVEDPANIRWGDLGAEIVIESTGRFTARKSAEAHLLGGAEKVIISAPAQGDDVPTYVLGVNDGCLEADTSNVFSNGSCTTNSLAPMAKVLNDSFDIRCGIMTTVHAYTSDQRLQDSPHSDLRRARAAALSTIPTSSGAATTIGKVIPKLEGRMTGLALRVPVPVGSITDLTVTVENPPAAAEEVNSAFLAAASSGSLAKVLKYSDAPLVSADIVGDPSSCVFDAPLTQVVNDQIKVFGWYDNEWAFSCRLVQFAERISGRS